MESASEAFEISRRASELYPYNYYLPAWASLIALGEARNAATTEEFDAAASIAFWCAREAVSLNPYDASARFVWAEALAETGRVDEALEFWRGVVDREFWNPDNHDELAWLLLRAGTPETRAQAVRELPFVTDQALKRRLQRIAKPPKAKPKKVK